MSFGIPLRSSNRFNSAYAASHQVRGGRSTFAGSWNFQSAEGNEFLDFEVTLNWRHDSRNSAISPGPVHRSPCSVKSACREAICSTTRSL